MFVQCFFPLQLKILGKNNQSKAISIWHVIMIGIVKCQELRFSYMCDASCQEKEGLDRREAGEGEK